MYRESQSYVKFRLACGRSSGGRSRNSVAHQTHSEMLSRRGLLGTLGVALLLSSCQGMYYSTMARFGIDKRDILIERLDKTSEAMSRLDQRFEEMSTAYGATIHLEGGDLPAMHKEFAKSYDRTESAATSFHSRIGDIHSVAGALFEEWKLKTGEILDPDLREQSLRNFGHAQTSYTKLVRTMREVETEIDPVLTRFRDHVVFLKLNLHRMTLSSLQETEEELLLDVEHIRELLAQAIDETAAFTEQIDY